MHVREPDTCACSVGSHAVLFLPETGNTGWHSGPATASEVLGKLVTVMLLCSSACELNLLLENLA